MASIERTAYPRLKRFMSARELHVFYTSQPDEIVWAREATSSDEHLLVSPSRGLRDIRPRSGAKD